MAARPRSRAVSRAPSKTAPSLRSDAERNRQAILSAATAAFARDGLDASLEEIARSAGVGSATLYRRFPKREDLIAAAVEDCIAAYADLVEQACEAADPWVGFCDLLRAVGDRQETDAGLSDLLAMAHVESTPLGKHSRRALDALNALVARAKAEGSLRSDFTVDDATTLFIANAGIITTGRSDSHAMRVRHTDLIIDALRANDRPRRKR